MKFTRLVRVYSWMDPIVFGNNLPSRTTDTGGGKCVLKTSFSFLSQMVCRFLRKKLENCISYQIYPKNDYIYCCRPMPRSLKNCHVSPPQIIFRCYFDKYCFFRKSCQMKNIQNVNAYKKGYIDTNVSSLQNGHVLPQIGFSQFSPKILLFSKNLFYNKTFVT